MTNDRKARQNLRSALILSSVILSALLIVVISFGIYNTRSRLTEMSDSAGQYYSSDLREKKGKPLEGGVIALKSNVTRKYKIAILLTNLGLNENAASAIAQLPKEVSFGFYPYITDGTRKMFYDSLKYGHEMYLYIPFDSGNKALNPGRLPILIKNSVDQNMQNLDTLLSSVSGYRGLYASSYEVFTKSKQFEELSGFLEAKDLLLVLPRSERPKSSDFTRVSDVFIADGYNDSEIRTGLSKLIDIARNKSSALGYIEFSLKVARILTEWTSELQEYDLELVPVSELVEH